MTRVVLVRHGQTIWNQEMKYQGHTDIALTEEGLRQAELVAKRMKEYEITAVYSSDLERATKTAECIGAQFGLSVVTVPQFREISFGQWEGKTYEGIQENQQWAGTMQKLFTHPDEVQIPGGETFGELKERASAAISKLISQHYDQTIAVVSHGGTIRAVLCAALNIHLNYFWNIRQDNTAVNVIDYYAERAIVSLVNDTHHLIGEEKRR